jgi:hypothetical protein
MRTLRYPALTPLSPLRAEALMPAAQTQLVRDGVRTGRVPSITARPTADEKRRFAELASSRGMSESTLALIGIRSLLDSNGPPAKCVEEPVPATDRITIRLRPGDHQAIARRAAQRAMKVSTYLAALVRAHVAANPPLAATELTALKQSIIVLAGLGRLLIQTARNPSLGREQQEDLRQQLRRTHAAVAAVEERTHELARAALISWETDSA